MVEATGNIATSRLAEGNSPMKILIKSAMLWRFLGGFALGGLGVLALHPATAETTSHAPTTVAATR